MNKIFDSFSFFTNMEGKYPFSKILKKTEITEFFVNFTSSGNIVNPIIELPQIKNRKIHYRQNSLQVFPCQKRMYCQNVSKTQIPSYIYLNHPSGDIAGKNLIKGNQINGGLTIIENYYASETQKNQLKIDKIPVRAERTVERKKPIELIHKLFSASNQTYPIVAIVGDPASGKTELSKQYAEKYRDAYHHIWFVQTEEWKTNTNELAKQLSWTQPEGKKSLIIFDNASEGFIERDLKGQLPRQTDILITSRSSNWEQTVNLSQIHELHLTLEEGIQILQNWVGGDGFNFTEAEKIVLRFKCSPVPIAQAGCYLFKSKENLRAYLPIFERNKEEILKQGALKGDIDIAVSLKIIMNQINQEEPEALKLLRYCAYLPPKNIPKHLLEKLCDSDRMKLNRYLQVLDSLILIANDSITIHDLFQEIIEEETQDQKEEILSDLGKAVGGFDNFLMRHPEKRTHIYDKRLEDLILESNTNKSLLGEKHIATGMSYNDVAVILNHLGRYEEVLTYGLKTLEILKEMLGEEHSGTAQIYKNISVVLGY